MLTSLGDVARSAAKNAPIEYVLNNNGLANSSVANQTKCAWEHTQPNKAQENGKNANGAGREQQF
jgi:hypothetical protein